MDTYEQTSHPELCTQPDAGETAGMCVSFSAEDGALYGTLHPGLTDMAWGGRTLGEIFSAPCDELIFGHFERGLMWSHIVGDVTLSSDCSVSPPSSMRCSGGVSAQIKGYLPASGHRYFLGAAVFCTRHSRGGAGVSVSMAGRNFYSCVGVNDDFQPLGLCFDATAPFTWYAGTMQQADADAFVDELVLVDMTRAFGDDMPTDRQMLELYSRYIHALQGRGIRYRLSEAETVYPFRACMSAFLAAMRKKAAAIGMDNTHITSPSGLSLDNTSTVRSMNRVNMAACGYEVLGRIWGKKSRAIEVRGSQARTEVVESTVQDPAFEREFHILGGKTGTYQLPDGLYSALLVTAADRKGRAYCGCVMKAASRWVAMLELFRKMERAADDPSYDPYAEPLETAECVIGWALPGFPASNAEQYLPPVIYEKNADQVCITASLVKTLSVVTALEYITDVNAWYTISAEDLRGGSGNVFRAGDRVRVADLLYAMMLPSSNTAATALAHYVGEKILLDT